MLSEMKIKLMKCLNICVAFAILLILNSCQQTKEKDLPWHHPSNISPFCKYLSSYENYQDSNYLIKYNQVFDKFIKEKQYDSALHCLLSYSNMVDLNYLYDSGLLVKQKIFLNSWGKEVQEESQLLRLYYYIGAQYQTIGNIEQATVYFKECINSSLAAEITKSACRTQLATIFINTQKADSAIFLQLQNLDFFLKEKDTVNIAITHGNLATYYGVLGARNLFKDNIYAAVNLAKQTKDTGSLLNYLYIQGSEFNQTYQDTLNSHVIADEMRSIESKYSKKSPHIYIMMLELLLNKYFDLNRMDSVKKYLPLHKKTADYLQNAAYLMNNYNYEVSYQIAIGQWYYDETKLKDLADYLEFYNRYLEANNIYSNLYKEKVKEKKWEQAVNYSNEVARIKDLVYTQNNKGLAYELELKYDKDRKENEIKEANIKIKKKEGNIIKLIMALILITAISSSVFFYYKQLNLRKSKNLELNFTHQLLENIEIERKRIAKDLHDGIGHELLNLKRNTEKSDYKIDEILNEIRQISRNLHPVMFDQIGLKLSVEHLVENFQVSQNLFVNLTIQYNNSLIKSSELQIYRIIQEALSNIKKYSQAHAANIIIQEKQSEFELVIEDNGKGFDVEKTLESGNAFGLFGIIQRCKTIGGNAQITSSNEGTKILILIPIHA